MPWGRTSGVLILLLTISLLPSCGMFSARSQSSYLVEIPVLTKIPIDYDCTPDGSDGLPSDGVEYCTCLSLGDYQAIVLELKSACIALGGSRGQCLTK